MATTKTAPKTAPKTTRKTVNKPVAKKTAAKPVAKKPVAQKTGAQPVAAAQAFVADAVETVTDQADAVTSFARDFALASVGMPFVMQKQFRQFPAVNLDSVKAMLTERPDFAEMKSRFNVTLKEAKAIGADRVAEFQGRVQPFAEKIEARLPDPLVKVIETGRNRVRHLIAA